jgi:hypothetical protein
MRKLKIHINNTGLTIFQIILPHRDNKLQVEYEANFLTSTLKLQA